MIALFPGQGSQHVGMAKELFADFKVVRETFEEASDACHLELKKLCFDGPDSDLTLTEHTQPCLLTASVAAFRVAQRELGFVPHAVAGHSLGEYSALVAAGALDLGTAAHWVRARGAAMQIAVPAGQGTMAAVLGAEDEMVERLCIAATAAAKAKRSSDGTLSQVAGETVEWTVDAIVQPANYNAPGQLVIAGSVDAVAEAIALLKAGGEFSGKAIPLSVSAPFHCALMRPARDRMADLFAKATSAQRPRALDCAYVPNRTARLTQESGVILELLVEQVDHPVLWKQTVLTLANAGELRAVEFGPGKVLQGLLKRIGSPQGEPWVSSGVADVAGVRALEADLKGKK